MAVDATGTPTSPDSLPTYNTAVDAPSGKGLNNIVAAIQAALTSSYARKPVGVQTNDVPIWNGTGWSRPSGTPDVSKVLRGDGTWSGAAAYRFAPTFVQNTTAGIDLLGGFTIPANALSSTTGHLRLTALGNYQNQTAGAVNAYRFGLGFGGATPIDSNTSPVTVHATSAGIFPWRFTATIMNNNATNSQYIVAELMMTALTANQAGWSPAAGSGVTMADENQGAYTFVKGQYYAAAAKDMTVGQALNLYIVLPVASTNCTITLTGATVEVL